MGKDDQRARFHGSAGRVSTMRLVLGALATGLLLLGLAPSAMAQTQDPNDLARWTCRGSATRVHLLNLERVEPTIANGFPSNANPDKPNCSDAVDNATDLAVFPPQPGSLLGADTARAATDIEPDGRPSAAQTASAGAIVEAATLFNGAIEIDAAQASARMNCQSGAAVASQVVGVRVGGTTISLDALVEGVEVLLAPAGPLVFLQANTTHTQGSPLSGDFKIIRRALEVRVLQNIGQFGLATAVVGEAEVDSHNNPCLPEPSPGPCPPGTTQFPNPSPGPRDPLICGIIIDTGHGPPCTVPEFELNGRCVLFVPTTTGGFNIGGFLVPLSAVRADARFRNSPCVAGNDPGFAIFGTNGPDRITGTNGPDRIFVLGGNDRVDGGRGNDCEEGGSGRDVLDGANDNDRLRGDTGSDILNGGSGRDFAEGQQGRDRTNGGSGVDRLEGGTGRDRLFSNSGNDRVGGGSGGDFINTGNGRDSIRGGSGRDTVNASTAGKPSAINCGGNRGDTARINPNERRRVRRCARVLVVRSR